MRITKKLDTFVVHKDISVKLALDKLEKSGQQILFVIDSDGRLMGIVTDGDVRRWLMKQPKIDLTKPIILVAPSSCVSANINDSSDQIKRLINRKIKQLPLLDEDGILKAIATSASQYITIGDKEIGSGKPVYIIAEVGNNHQGKLDEAKALIDMASEAGVDSVKFQMRSMEALYGKQSNKRSVSQDLGVQYTSDLLSKFQLSDDDLFKAFDHCKLNEVEPICTPWDLESLKKLEDYGMEAYKVASADITNHELLRELAKTHVPLICSTGMSTDDEILESSELLKSLGVQGILLHCNSTYPTPFKDVNLNYIRVLRKFGFETAGYNTLDLDKWPKEVWD